MTRKSLILLAGVLNLSVVLIGCVSSGVSECAKCSNVDSQVDYRGQTPGQVCPQASRDSLPVNNNNSVPLTVSSPLTGEYQYNNVITVTSHSPIVLWESIVSVVSQYFPIVIETPCRQIGEQATSDGLTTSRTQVIPGSLITGRAMGATIFEPWRRDSVGFRERWESTLHSISRRAMVRVWSLESNTFAVEVIVNKEIENSQTLDNPSTGQGNYFLSDSRSSFRDKIITDSDDSQWVYKSRDPLLEQRILAEIMAKVN